MSSTLSMKLKSTNKSCVYASQKTKAHKTCFLWCWIDTQTLWYMDFFSVQVNESGFPTLDGLLAIYTEGVTDKEYFVATAQAIHGCLQATQKTHLIAPQSLEGKSRKTKSRGKDDAYLCCCYASLMWFCNNAWW